MEKPISEMTFLSRDHSGRGEKPTTVIGEWILKFWELTQADEDGNTLEEWLSTCQPGDVFQFERETLERIG